MNNVLRGILATTGVVGLATVQRLFVDQPWRYVIGTTELVILTVTVVVLWGRTKYLLQTSTEHQARLDAIAGFAERAQVVHDANRIVDAIQGTLYVHEVQEAVDSQE